MTHQPPGRSQPPSAPTHSEVAELPGQLGVLVRQRLGVGLLLPLDHRPRFIWAQGPSRGLQAAAGTGGEGAREGQRVRDGGDGRARAPMSAKVQAPSQPAGFSPPSP